MRLWWSNEVGKQVHSYFYSKKGVTTTSLQVIVENTVANHFIDSEMDEGIV